MSLTLTQVPTVTTAIAWGTRGLFEDFFENALHVVLCLTVLTLKTKMTVEVQNY